MRNKQYYLLVLLFTAGLYSQSLPLPTRISSPTAANLGKYGDIGVSYNTGSPDVSIPLYSLNVKDIPLDVSLNYNTNGVIVYDLPTWVGQNWSLNAGGVITRQINYYPDEMATPPNVVFSSRGYFYPMSHDRLNVSNWSDLDYLAIIDKSNWGAQNCPDPGYAKDSQPDIFTFNFMGHTGKFFMGEDGEWKVASSSNLKVKILESDFVYPFGQSSSPVTGWIVSKTIGKIQLIDDQGITYTFGFTWDNSSEVKAIEYSKNFFDQRTDTWFPTAWYLVKVTNAQNIDVYNLTYERETGYTANFYHNTSWTGYKASFDDGGYFNGGSTGCQFHTGSDNGAGSGAGSPAISGSVISPVYLKKITAINSQTLTFNSVNSPEGNYKAVGTYPLWLYLTNQMSYINITYGSYEAVNHFSDFVPYGDADGLISQLKFRKLSSISDNFGASTSFYYNTSNLSQIDERLNLLRVTIGYDKIYSMEYDRFDQLPGFLSKAIDHLGYYNGTEYPTPASSNASHYNYRNSHSDKVKIGSLTKLIYPTKGYTNFQYEPHNYSRYVKDDKTGFVTVSNSIIGGIRIKKIENHDGNNNIEVKEYKYVQDYALNHDSTLSSGTLTNKPKYFWEDWRGNASGANGYILIDHFSTNPILPMENFFGSPVTYNEVAEVKSDGSYTVYKYTGFDDYMDEAYVSTYNGSVSPYGKGNDRSFLRGKLKSKETFNASNFLVAKTVNTYDTNGGLEIKYARGTNISDIACSGTPGYGFYFGNAYRIYYFDNDLTKTTEYLFADGQQLIKENKFNYQYYPDLATSFGDRVLISKSNQVYRQDGESDSEKTEELYAYPFNSTTAISTDMTSKRMFLPIKKVLTRNNEVLFTEKVDYSYFSPNNALLPKTFYKSKGNNPLEETVMIDTYDGRGNVTQFHNTNGMYTTLSWCYNLTYPIAKLEGPKITDDSYIIARRNAIQVLLGNGPTAPLSNWMTAHTNILAELNLLRNNFPNHLVTTYTYRPFMGVMSINDSTGVLKSFSYDIYGRLLIVKDAEGKILSTNDYHYKP